MRRVVEMGGVFMQLKWMRQDQEAGPRVAGGLQKSLEKVKKEKTEAEEGDEHKIQGKGYKSVRQTCSSRLMSELKTFLLVAGADASDVQIILNHLL